MKPTLELPKTLRAPELYEVPRSPAVKERLELRKSAQIVEGYRILPKGNNPDHTELAFSFYVEININNSKLWNLILALSEELPDEASLIFSYKDYEPNFGKYTEKSRILGFLSNFKKEIVADTFIEIGLIFHSDTELIEVFIPDSKYVKFWGVDKNSFLKIMDEFQLKEIEGIEFVDEYPRVSEALRLFEDDVKESKEIIELLKKEFG